MDAALSIRPATIADAGSIAAIYAHYVANGAITFEVDPAPSVDDMAARIAAILPHFPYLVAEQDGHVLGYAYATKLYDRAAYRWAVEGTVYLGPDSFGRGIGTILYRRLIDELRERGFQSVFGKITLPNPASTGLHERMGFRLAGILSKVGFKNGAWHDVGIYQLDLSERPVEPAEPETSGPI